MNTSFNLLCLCSSLLTERDLSLTNGTSTVYFSSTSFMTRFICLSNARRLPVLTPRMPRLCLVTTRMLALVLYNVYSTEKGPVCNRLVIWSMTLIFALERKMMKGRKLYSAQLMKVNSIPNTWTPHSQFSFSFMLYVSNAILSFALSCFLHVIKVT